MGGYVLKHINSTNVHSPKEDILGLDDHSIIAACKLCSYDYLIRTDIRNPVNEQAAIPDSNTIHNIRVMIKRVLSLNDIRTNFQDCSLTFKNGYTSKIGKGDADLLANDCLIDLKTSKYDIENKDILQICCYYLLGKNSHKGTYKTMNAVGIFNPRLNVYHKYVFNRKTIKKLDPLKKKIGING